MLSWELAVCFCLGLFLLFALGRALLCPPRLLWRLTALSLAGAAGMWLFNRLSFLTGMSVPVNPFTALTVGTLGLPGLVLVLALSRLL